MTEAKQQEAGPTRFLLLPPLSAAEREAERESDWGQPQQHVIERAKIEGELLLVGRGSFTELLALMKRSGAGVGGGAVRHWAAAVSRQG
jgi:hypothetical protein